MFVLAASSVQNLKALRDSPTFTHHAMKNYCFHRRVCLLVTALIPSFFVACAQEPLRVIETAQPQVDVPWQEEGEDWSAFLGKNGNGQSSEKGVDTALWAPHPPIIWELPLGTSYGGPAVVGKKLYQFDRVANKERLTCYDVLSARPLWYWESEPVFYRDMFGYNNGPRCSPIVDGNLIFLYGVTGQLHCIDAQTQKELWSVDTFKQYGVIPNFFGVASNPVVHGDLLLVMVGGSPKESQGLTTEQIALVKPNGSAVIAFDKFTGKEIYRVGNDLASYASLTVQSLGGKPAGLAFLRSGLIAFDPENGKELFQYPWRAEFRDSVNASVPITDGEKVFISESYQIGSTMLETTSVPWSIHWKDDGVSRNRCKFRAHWATPVLVDGYLYGCNGRNADDSDFRCIRWDDGELKWSDRRHERSSVTLVDGYLIVLGEYGKLDLVRPNPEKLDIVASCDLSQIEASDGRPLLSEPCWASPVISHGLMYLRGNDRLICMQLIPKK